MSSLKSLMRHHKQVFKILNETVNVIYLMILKRYHRKWTNNPESDSFNGTSKTFFLLLTGSGRSSISRMGGGTNLKGGGANLSFGQLVSKNCLKMKEFGPRRGHTTLPPPPGSANDEFS